MALESPIHSIGWLLAAADLSLKQYYIVKLTSTGVNLTGAGEGCLGVLQNDPLSGDAADVGDSGVTKVVYGNTVTKGDSLMSDANGKAIPLTSTNACVGIALESGVAGQVGTMFLANKTGGATVNNYSVLSLPVDLTKLANGELLTDYIPGFAGSIVAAQFVVTDPVTTAAKAASLALAINETPVTGGVLALTSANCTPLGKFIAGTAVTAANAFLATDSLEIDVSGVTTFVEGKGVLWLVLKTA